MNVTPWLRVIKVTLQTDFDNRKIVVESNGTLNTLRITGTFNKSIMGFAQKSSLNIYNFSNKLRDNLYGTRCKVKVEAGYANTELKTLFIGNALNCFSSRAGADVVTTFELMSGYAALSSGVSSRSFAEGTPLATVVKTLTKDVPDIPAEVPNIQGVISAGGWSFAGSTKQGLTELCSEYGLSWTSYDDKLVITEDKKVLPSDLTLDADAGLIAVTPEFTGPFSICTGLKIKSLYIPGIFPGSSITLKSTLVPKLNRTYKVTSQVVNVDCYSSSWTMGLTCKFFNF